MVMEVVHEDMGEGNMQCADHPYKNSTPGGICAFCLQEKLGKLVSSSFPLAIFPSSSSSSSPSFRSDFGGGGNATSTATATAAVSSLQVRRHVSSSAASRSVSYNNAPSNDCSYNGYYSRRSRLPFILTHRKKKKKDSAAMAASSDPAPIVFKRSKSTATPRRGTHFLDENFAEDYSPHKWGFWSFLYLSRNSNSTTKKPERPSKDSNFPSASASSVSTAGSTRDKKTREFVVVEENESPDDQAAFDRKVSRSRSVGCGSRSFSGDFFERISTGFGDCALRRVESQREGRSRISSAMHKNGGNNNGQVCIKERVRCGGIFSGFTISSSSSSSSYRASSSTEDNVNGKSSSTTPGSVRNLSHGRSKSWGWAFASPMRAFSKPSSGKRDSSANKNAAPNLAAIPSLLAVRS
ncbi:uncharacterized protein LOC111393383 [Olea europaea var. sylvestris]|uniref:Vitellogenin-like protein n=1 Tax=Olea europaea subsp. europaea TaxID=158383 RepID=A0A8S0RK37_OLEEU|nr:uncharacterized protein LOC111393383 [Olea europaea var. sylvestris]CAA2980084.1 Hypothetical predicted protein [Olea europaea subsp. europaea]